MRLNALRCALSFSLCLALSACGGTSTNGTGTHSSTFVHLRFSAGSGLDATGAGKIVVTAMLAGQTAMVTVGDGKSLTLPTDKVLQIEHASGTMTATAVLLASDGTTLGNASGSVDVERGATIDLALAFAPANQQPPPGTPMLTMDHTPSYDFGTVVVGASSAPLTLTVTNSGTATTSMLSMATLDALNTQFAIGTDNCMGMLLDPGATCTITVVLNASAVGTANDTISLSATSGGSVSTQLIGNVLAPGTISFQPTSFNFGNVAIGSTSDNSFTVVNNGNGTSGAITILLSGSDAGSFSIVNNTCEGIQLQVAKACHVTVRMTASAPAGTRGATLEADATPGGPAVTSLTATAQNPAVLQLAPAGATYDFAKVAVGSPSKATFTISNNGQQASGGLNPLPWLSGDSTFSISGGSCMPGAMLAGGDSCTVEVTFTPTTFGSQQANLALTAAPGGSINVALTADGTVTSTLTVSRQGSGAGGVTSSPSGIDCGATCSANYTYDATAPTVTLTAAPANGSLFTGWTGCTPVSGSPAQCTVVMSGNATVAAQFDDTPASLSLSQSSYNFGFVAAGSSATQTFTLTNGGNSTTGNLAISSSETTDFSISGGTCVAGQPMAANATCTIVLKFAPVGQGTLSTTLSVSASPGGAVSLSATGQSCSSVTHMCGGSCYAADDREHCGNACSVCGATQVCNSSCVTAPVLAIASQPYDPTGWTDSSNKPITVTLSSVGVPGAIYECRSGPESTFTPTSPAFTACDGAGGSGLTHTPKSNASTPEGSYRTEARYRSGDYTSNVVVARYYAHHSLDDTPLCSSVSTIPHFSDAQLLAAAQAFSSANPTLFPTSSKFPAPSATNSVAWSDPIVLRQPFIKIPFVGIKPTSSAPWAGTSFTLTELFLRHRFTMNANDTLLLDRRDRPTGGEGSYVSPENYCYINPRMRNDRSLLGRANSSSGRRASCLGLVLNAAGQGLCMVSDNKASPSPIVWAYDNTGKIFPPGNGVLTFAANSTSVTSTIAFPTGAKMIIDQYGQPYDVVSVSGLTATLATQQSASYTTPSGQWKYAAAANAYVFPTGFAKIYEHDSHDDPGHQRKCATAGCNTGKPWMLYLPQ